MSSVASLYNVPSSDQELETWSFAHAAHHRDVNARIYLLTKIALAEYVLDPFNPQDSGVWVYQHQQMHSIVDQILGIDGFDLSDVDFGDTGSLAAFVYLNGNEHYQMANILNLG